jgi:hypothetical protein
LAGAKGLCPERTLPPGNFSGLDEGDNCDHTGLQEAKQSAPRTDFAIRLGNLLMRIRILEIA